MLKSFKANALCSTLAVKTNDHYNKINLKQLHIAQPKQSMNSKRSLSKGVCYLGKKNKGVDLGF